MQIDDRDYYLDLLFYHRKLHEAVVLTRAHLAARSELEQEPDPAAGDRRALADRRKKS